MRLSIIPINIDKSTLKSTMFTQAIVVRASAKLFFVDIFDMVFAAEVSSPTCSTWKKLSFRFYEPPCLRTYASTCVCTPTRSLDVGYFSIISNASIDILQNGMAGHA